MALVAFLRGVNVGGHRAFRPTSLAAQLQHLDAVNIGAAGTFVIRRAVSRDRLRTEISSRLPFATDVMICEGRELTRLLSHDAFAAHATKGDIVRFVSILARPPSDTLTLPIVRPDRGKWLMKILARDGRFALGVYRRDMKVVGYLGQMDGLFGVPATTRNWNTIAAIAKVLGRE